MEPRIDFQNGQYRAVVPLGTGIPAWLGPLRSSHAAARRHVRELERKLAAATVADVWAMAEVEAWAAAQFGLGATARARHRHNAMAFHALARVRRRLEQPVIPAGSNVVEFRRERV